MDLRSVTGHEAVEAAAQLLGVETDHLYAPEGLAAALRRAASFICPTSRRRLVDNCCEALRQLPQAPDDLRDLLKQSLDDLLSLGDLIEAVSPGTEGFRIYLRTPSFVRLDDQFVLLLGVRPDAESLTTSTTAEDVRARGALRLLRLTRDRERGLAAEGFAQLARATWLGQPRQESARAVFERYMERILAAAPADLPDCEIIDSPGTRHFKGRFRSPVPSDDGLFVGRRQLRYGARQWCVLLLVPGERPRVLDLPILNPVVPAVDEARRLLAACDAVDGRPQRVRVTREGHDTCLLQLDAPLPFWCERYLLASGTVARRKGALVTYEVPVEARVACEDFLIANLWMIVEG